MFSLKTNQLGQIIRHTTKTVALLLLITLFSTPPTLWADEGAVPAGQQATTEYTQPAAGSPTTSTPENDRKNNLGGFFTIGAIINILFLGAFIFWARKESQKSKQKKLREKT